MPGHVGTSIVINSFKAFGRDPKELDESQIAQIRERFDRRGLPLDGASDEDIRQGMQMQAEAFRDAAPTTASQAATVILDGVRAGAWRILVGDDAVQLDELVRDAPNDAYEPSFLDHLEARGIFQFGL